MCELLSNKTADEHFEEVIRSGEKQLEKRLIELAGEATRTRAEGLELKLKEGILTSWVHDPQLRTVRKCTIGRHRVYVEGRNTDCRFIVRYIKLFKKTGVDEEQTLNFKNRILKALQEPRTRTLRGPDQ